MIGGKGVAINRGKMMSGVITIVISGGFSSDWSQGHGITPLTLVEGHHGLRGRHLIQNMIGKKEQIPADGGTHRRADFGETRSTRP